MSLPNVLLNLPRIGLAGYFTVELIDAKTQRVKRALRFENIITNAGLDFPINGTPLTQMNYLAVGTGSATPVATDSQLDAEITPNGRTNSNGGIADATGYNATPEYLYYRRTRTFFESQANGNLTELGFFPGATGTELFNRQLFRDTEGVPTTITKTDQEQLRITYELRIQPPQSDVSGTFVVSGVTYGYIVRPLSVTGAWGQLFASGWTSDLLGMAYISESNVQRARTDSYASITTPNSAVYGAYVAGQFYREGTSTWEPTAANFATGIGGVYMANTSNGLCFHAAVTPKIPKTLLYRFTITVRTSWGRA